MATDNGSLYDPDNYKEQSDIVRRAHKSGKQTGKKIMHEIFESVGIEDENNEDDIESD